MYNHWFITRQKRQLTGILPALICFNDICEGKVWKGNKELQLEFEDVLSKRDITRHGSLRARKVNAGGGGTRTLFTQLKDLGLVFVEEKTNKVRLTLIAEDLINAKITFTEAIRRQLFLYQYPSATRYKGSGAVNHDIRVHPFVFMFKLLREKELTGYLTMDEMKSIIIHEGVSDNVKCLKNVVKKIVDFRSGNLKNIKMDTLTNTYKEIANTFFNYIELTGFIERGKSKIFIKNNKIKEVDNLIQKSNKFIKNPEVEENYQRTYGVGNKTKDLRTFSKEKFLGRKEMEESRIRSEYALLRLETPIIEIDDEIINKISSRTGINYDIVEKFLLQCHSYRSVDDFLLTYKNYAYGGRKYALEFELATVEIFRKMFKMNAKHIGSIGNTPDVFVESEIEKYSGIIDNKAYESGYSIIGDHKRRMTDEYIPNVKKYANAKYPLAFFSYISTNFGKNINEQLREITNITKINGSAIPVDIFIKFVENYQKNGYNHKHIKKLFSFNKKISVEDL